MFKITIEPKPSEISRRLRGEFGRAKKGAFLTMGAYWHQHFRKRHFATVAYREYDYAPRKGDELPFGSREFWRSYVGRKLRKMGHRLPLVYSGASRTLAKIRDVRATSKGGRIMIHAPTLNLRPKGGRINLREEMARISPREWQKMLRVCGRELNRRWKRGLAK